MTVVCLDIAPPHVGDPQQGGARTGEAQQELTIISASLMRYRHCHPCRCLCPRLHYRLLTLCPGAY